MQCQHPNFTRKIDEYVQCGCVLLWIFNLIHDQEADRLSAGPRAPFLFNFLRPLHSAWRDAAKFVEIGNLPFLAKLAALRISSPYVTEWTVSTEFIHVFVWRIVLAPLEAHDVASSRGGTNGYANLSGCTGLGRRCCGGGEHA